MRSGMRRAIRKGGMKNIGSERCAKPKLRRPRATQPKAVRGALLGAHRGSGPEALDVWHDF